MKNSFKIFLFAVVAAFSSSCLKQTESITPLAEVRTLAQLQRESMMNTALLAAGNNELSKDAKASLETNIEDPSIFYLNLKYNIINMDVYETASIANSFEQIGNSFLKIFAKIFLKLTGSRTVNIGNIDLPISDLNLDFNIVKSLKIRRIYVEYNKDYDASTGNKANFSFINTFNLSRVSGANPLLVSYKKTKNTCLQKCLNFDIIEGNILDLVKSSSTIDLKPSLTIGGLPAVTELKIDGQIDLQIGLKLPF
ncbi:MAG: hypothetical protein PHY93_08345 [Bacteriovorax sp.]|nr:hypothetical protein [Bacteriovorax sp.]